MTVAQPHQFAHHPPAGEPRQPEAARKRGVAAGAEAERDMQATSDAWNRKIGTSALKTIAVPGRK